ncbi:MAG: pilus assembly protein N-terminal domain-containing protein [Pseudorhodoplanes sp.]
MTFSPTLSGLKGLVRHIVVFAAVAGILAAPGALAGELGPDDTLDVVVDRSRLVKMPDRVATIVIGNPLIADASLQAGGLLVLTGKGYGTTNLIALDRKGNALMEKSVQVLGPQQDVVVVYKGVNRETYSCAPFCNPTVTLGDAQQFFSQHLARTVTRSSQAQAIGSPR